MVVAVKFAEVADVATVTLVGTDSAELESPSVTLLPPEGAALPSVTVQEVEALGPMMDGLQVRDDTSVADATRLIVVLPVLPL